MSESYPEIEELDQVNTVREFLGFVKDEEATRKINEKCRVEGERKRNTTLEEFLKKYQDELDKLMRYLKDKIDEDYPSEIVEGWIYEYFEDHPEIIGSLKTLKKELENAVEYHKLLRIKIGAANSGWDRLGLILSDKVEQRSAMIGGNLFRINPMSRMARFRIGIEVKQAISKDEAFATITNNVGPGYNYKDLKWEPITYTCANELMVWRPISGSDGYECHPCSLFWDSDGTLRAGIDMRPGDRISQELYVNLASYSGGTKYRYMPQSVVDRTVEIMRGWASEPMVKTTSPRDFRGCGWAYYSTEEGKRRSKVTGTRKFSIKDGKEVENGLSAGMNIAINSIEDRSSNCGGVIRLAIIQAYNEYLDSDSHMHPDSISGVRGVPQSATSWAAFGVPVCWAETHHDIDWSLCKPGDVVCFFSRATGTYVHVAMIVDTDEENSCKHPIMLDLTSSHPDGNQLMNRLAADGVDENDHWSLAKYYSGYRKLVVRWSTDAVADEGMGYEIELEVDNETRTDS